MLASPELLFCLFLFLATLFLGIEHSALSHCLLLYDTFQKSEQSDWLSAGALPCGFLVHDFYQLRPTHGSSRLLPHYRIQCSKKESKAKKKKEKEKKKRGNEKRGTQRG
jgi:hypothetical protein